MHSHIIMSRVLNVTSWMLALIGILLMGVNLYGLTQDIRKPGLGIDNPGELRFVPDEVLSYEQSMAAISALVQIKNKDEAVKNAVEIVHKSLVHPDWFRVDPEEYRQLVPIWENYFLYAIGKFSDLPQFNRYHYADYKHSIERGIGVCGDAAIVLDSVLKQLGVNSRILSFKDHVIVGYRVDSGDWHLADPDFGVVLSPTLQQLRSGTKSAEDDYLKAGYSEHEYHTLDKVFKKPFVIFEDPYDFMKLRYVFEYASYVLKWVLPPLFLLPVSYFWIRNKRQRRNSKKGNLV